VQKILKATPQAGGQMPPYGKPLSSKDRTMLINWIKQGAKNN
jgi:hypothetical protein